MDGFDSEAFDTWLAEDGNEYLNIDPYTNEGLKKVAKFNALEIVNPEEFWTENNLVVLYGKVLELVQDKGRYGDWTLSPEEGLHRITGSIIKTLMCKLDDDGRIDPYSIEAKHFADTGVGELDDMETAQQFRERMYESRYNADNPGNDKIIQVRACYFTTGGLNGCEAAYWLRSRSKRTSVNKKQSADRCKFDLMGQFLKGEILSITEEGATDRMDYQESCPTHLAKTTQSEYYKMIEMADDDFGRAFPWSSLYDKQDYGDYCEHPFQERSYEGVKTLLATEKMDGYFHVQQGDAYEEAISRPTSNNKVPGPWLPSVASLNTDVGEQFRTESKHNSDTMNMALLAPRVHGYLYAAVHNKTLEEVEMDETRRKELEYYLRMHVNHGDSATVPKMHIAYTEHYKLGSGKKTYLCNHDTGTLGVLDLVLTMFNSYLSVEAEFTIDKVWAVRKEHLKMMACEFGSIFSNIGKTKVGRDYTSVVTNLGTKSLDDFVRFEIFHLTSHDPHLLPASLHRLLGIYANLIYKNWAQYTSNKTKVKKPHMENLVFRCVQSNMVHILYTVGLFPKISSTAILPNLKLFHDYYTSPSSDKVPQIKKIATWVGEQIISNDNKSAVPIEVKTLIKNALFHEGCSQGSMFIPIMISAIVRFATSFSDRIDKAGTERVFDSGWLVDNSTTPTKYWTENNPPHIPKSPRNYPCIQSSRHDGSPMKYLFYLSELMFRQLDGEPLAAENMFLTVCEVENTSKSEEFAQLHNDIISWKEGFERHEDMTAVVTIPNFNTKSTPKKASPSKKGATKANSTDKTVDEQSNSTPTKGIPPSARKKRVKSGDPEQHDALTEDEKEHLEILGRMRWEDENLIPPNHILDDEDPYITRSVFYKSVLDFCEKIELAKWLATKSVERIKFLSKDIKKDLRHISSKLTSIAWQPVSTEIKPLYDAAVKKEKKAEDKKQKELDREAAEKLAIQKKRDDALQEQVNKIRKDAEEEANKILKQGQGESTHTVE